MKLIASLFAILAHSALAAGTGDVIRTAAELQSAVFDRAEVGRTFDLEVRLTTECGGGEEASFAVDDESGAMILRRERRRWKEMRIPAGARARARGFIGIGVRSRRAYANCLELDVTGHGPAPGPTPVTAAEFLSGRFDCRLVSVRAVVRDIVTDEINPDYKYVILYMDGETVPMPLETDSAALRPLSAGSRVEVVGVCNPTQLGMRRHLGRHMVALPGGVKLVANSKDSPFDAPLIADADFTRLRPQDIAALGRRRAAGRVIASWHGDSALVKCDDGRIVRIETDDGSAPPYGALIEAAGFPESDLYHINLSRAAWRSLSGGGGRYDETPRDVAAAELLVDTEDRKCFDPYVHGHAIRMRGIVRTMPRDGNMDGRFNIESGRYIVPVDASSAPGALDRLAIGSEVSVAGTCVMEADNWRPNLPFPAIRGFFVVVRRPSDVTVLSRPSWWTPPRLASITGLLMLVLIGVLAWNTSLKRLAERRGRELAATAIAKAESDLKVDERTRLAVALHDTISQNLTGISLALRAADRFAESAPDGLRDNLRLASVSLDSCRQELRNCLWDLRNNTLDETDMNDAIRRTLAPHVGDTELSIRFNVPREKFSDRTAHAILHIIRELATNAVRHGHAHHIRVAGSSDGDVLFFSVRDDGCGFHPASAPGMDKGHFGLQGVRERINQMEGSIEIASSPGRGTKVSVSIRLPNPSGRSVATSREQRI